MREAYKHESDLMSMRGAYITWRDDGKIENVPGRNPACTVGFDGSEYGELCCRPDAQRPRWRCWMRPECPLSDYIAKLLAFCGTRLAGKGSRCAHLCFPKTTALTALPSDLQIASDSCD
jgi:hypothetical protein